MLYDVRLELHYDYEASVHGDRHLVRVAPVSIPGVQRVIAAVAVVRSAPGAGIDLHRLLRQYRHHHRLFGLPRPARCAADRTRAGRGPPSAGRPVADCRRPASRKWLPCGRSTRTRRITSSAPRRASRSTPRSPPMPLEALRAPYRCRPRPWISASRSIATSNTTRTPPMSGPRPVEAFTLKGGVCQDFAHVMIAGLRGVGIPAGYVSGFLRTIPPKGKPRLEGADAMHAWVRVWCGAACRLDRVRSDQRHAGRPRSHHHRPRPRLFRHLAHRRRAAHQRRPPRQAIGRRRPRRVTPRSSP